jgi:hypothetical protein
MTAFVKGESLGGWEVIVVSFLVIENLFKGRIDESRFLERFIICWRFLWFMNFCNDC